MSMSTSENKATEPWNFCLYCDAEHYPFCGYVCGNTGSYEDDPELCLSREDIAAQKEWLATAEGAAWVQKMSTPQPVATSHSHPSGPMSKVPLHSALTEKKEHQIPMLTSQEAHDLIVNMTLDLATTTNNPYDNAGNFSLTFGSEAAMYPGRAQIAEFTRRARHALLGDLSVTGYQKDCPNYQAFGEEATTDGQMTASSFAITGELWQSIAINAHTDAAHILITGICQRLLAELTSCVLHDRDLRPTLTKIASMEGFVRRLILATHDQKRARMPFIVNHDFVVCPLWLVKHSEVVSQTRVFLKEYAGQTCKVSIGKDGTKDSTQVKITPPQAPAITFDYLTDRLTVNLEYRSPQIVIRKPGEVDANRWGFPRQ